MFRVILLSLTVLVMNVAPSRAFADAVEYSIVATYGPDAPVTSFTSPNTTFTLTFTVVVPNTEFISPVDVGFPFFPATYAWESTTRAITVAPDFFTSADGGGVDVLDGTGDFLWSFLGPQLFSGDTLHAVLQTGVFPIETPDSLLLSTVSTPSAFTSGFITATAVPEPATLNVVVGLGGIGALLCRRKRSVGLAGSTNCSIAKRMLPFHRH